MIRTFAAALATTTCIVALAAPAAAQTREFNVPAGSLRTALDAFARQSGRQVIYSGDVRSARSPGVRGARTAEAALDAILAGTGFVAKQDRSGALAIVKGGNAPGAPGNVASGEGDAANEIVVTGTNLRGLNPTSPIIAYSSRDLERQGFRNVQDFVRTIPQNFSGGSLGATEDGALGSGSGVQGNNEAATGINLRGLGESSTLVLLNGHRMAASAYGAVVDVSVIPIEALDRVDVVADGASAIYGSDAVAGVVNFILKRDYDGAATRIQYGSVTSGSLQSFLASQAIGKAWNTGSILASVQYSYQTALKSDERSATREALNPTDVYPHYNQYSGLFSAHQEIGDRLELFADGLAGRRNLSRTITRSTTSFTTSHARSESFNATAGARYRPFGDWRMELAGTWSKQALDLRFSEISPPQAGYTPGDVALKNRAELLQAEFKADGTVFELPGGPVKLAAGGLVRHEAYGSLLPYLSPSDPFRSRPFKRDTSAVYGEIGVPVIGPDNAVPLLRRLTLSAAIRYDHYSDFGGTTNPKFGVLFSPVADLNLRASWSKSFRAPNANDVQNQSFGLFINNDSFASPDGLGTVPVLVVSGFGQALSAERSRSYTIGGDYSPRFLPGARLTVTYYNINFRDRIITPPYDPGVLTRPDIYGALIQAVPDDAAAAAYIANIEAQGGSFFDLLGSGAAGVRNIYLATTQNAAFVRQSGWDIAGEYGFQTGETAIQIRMNAAIIDKIRTAFSSTSSPVDIANTYSNPLKFRMRADVSAARGPLAGNLGVNYSNKYTDTSSLDRQRVRSWTTLDASLRYALEGGDLGVLSGVSVAISAFNILNSKPPFVQGTGLPGIHYDVGNADVRGRFLSLELRKRW